MAKGPAVISGGLVLAATGQVTPSDLLLEDDLIVAITPRGSVTSASARRIDAANRLIIPGLINAHTHGHGGLAKGSGDRWSLETLLNAGIDVVVALVVLYFFVDGLGDGTVSSFNVGIWLLLLACIAAPMTGGWFLRSRGNLAGASAVLALVAVPGCLMGLLFLVLIGLPGSYH